MTEERLHQFQIALYETGEEELRKIAVQLADPKYQADGLRKYFLEKKLYRILGLMIDEESFTTLMAANKMINKLQNEMMAHGGWSTGRYGASDFTSEEIFYQDAPEEFKDGKRCYHVVRDENGYHTEGTTPEPGTFAYQARLGEERFLRERKTELAIMPQMFSIKERIMGGDYKINPKHAELAEFICEYFGYEKQPQEVPTK